jgi:hypothetical protein
VLVLDGARPTVSGGLHLRMSSHLRYGKGGRARLDPGSLLRSLANKAIVATGERLNREHREQRLQRLRQQHDEDNEDNIDEEDDARNGAQ